MPRWISRGSLPGAVASQYQADRVQTIADRLGLALFTPLWHMDPETLLHEVAQRMDAMIVVTAAEGLDAGFLGARFNDDLIRRLRHVAATRRSILRERGGNMRASRSTHRFIPGR